MKIEYKLVENPKNTYRINTSWMSGDADGYTDIEYTYNSEKEAIEIYLFLRNLVDEDFNDEDIKDKFYEKFDRNIYYIPDDVTSFGDSNASLSTVENPVYYNEDGIKYEMIIIED